MKTSKKTLETVKDLLYQFILVGYMHLNLHLTLVNLFLTWWKKYSTTLSLINQIIYRLQRQSEDVSSIKNRLNPIDMIKR